MLNIYLTLGLVGRKGEYCNTVKMIVAAILFACFSFTFSEKAEDYLEKYGYLNRKTFDAGKVEQALRNYQAFAGIPVTGKLDDATKKQMSLPRCGRPDVSANAYADSRWSKTTLSYSFKNFSPDLSQGQIKAIHSKALNLWSSVTPLRFSETSSNGDIKILFAHGNHGCGTPFDGPNRVLAHAFFPPSGELHYDEAETFTTGGSRGTDLDWVATHELGHILGLEHSNIQGAIMYPYYTGYDANLKLHSDDITRIQRQYGGSGGGGQTCVDNNSACAYWASIGECQKNPNYMLVNCKKSCMKC